MMSLALAVLNSKVFVRHLSEWTGVVNMHRKLETFDSLW